MKIKTKITRGAALLCFSTLFACTSPSNQTTQNTEKVPQKNTQSNYIARDVRDDIFYFVMPDRFNNANPANDNGSLTDKISYGGLQPSSRFGFHGGDMQGLEEKLDYLKEMGITAIWMTPILRNKAIQEDGVAHHGYWIIDFTQIDPHFGSNDDLKSLIDAAHKKNIKIFFDIITNHTADVVKYRECHNDDGTAKPGIERCTYKSLAQVASGDKYTPFLPDDAKDVKHPAWLNKLEYYHNQGDTTFKGENSLYGDFNGLDDLNTEHPDVLAGMIDIYKDIITEFKPDGFRIDTVRHVQLPFWQSFGPAIVEHAKELGIPNFHIFGEVYDPNPAHLSEFTTAGKLPAVLDFGFQKAVAQVFYEDKNPQVIKTLFINDDYYNDADSQADLLLTFLGNHDMGRPGYFINQGVSSVSQQEKLQRSILSHGFMYMSRGIPVVYYGDEQGFTGDGNDVDAREDMFASQVPEYNDNVLLGTEQTTAEDNFSTGHPIYSAIKDFAQLRLNHKALQRGIHVNRYFDEDSKAFAFSRIDPQERQEYLILFNTGTAPTSITLDAAASEYDILWGKPKALNITKNRLENNVQTQQLNVALAPLSFIVLRAKNTLPAQALIDLTLGKVTIAKDAEQRVHINYDMKNSSMPSVPLFEVKTEFKNAQGSYELAAKDYTYPYSAYIAKEAFTEKEPLDIRVTISNMMGEVSTKEFKASL